MINILITGGAGFIGSNLIKHLKNNYTESNIISLDNYSSGLKENHINKDGIKYIEGNTWDIFKIEEIKNFNPDFVFHLGEFSRIVLSFKKPDETFWSNLIGTQQIISYCVQKKAKLIYSGSSAIFENDNLNPYVFTKSKNIQLIKNYKKWFGLNYSIIYFYNVFGKNHISKGDYATVIGIFENQYKNKEPLTVVSPGTQTRCYTHIDDIIKGILKIMNISSNDEYYLSSNKNISVLDIAKLFNSDYIFIDKKIGEREKSLIIKNNKNFDWKAEIDIEDYIKDFISKNYI